MYTAFEVSVRTLSQLGYQGVSPEKAISNVEMLLVSTSTSILGPSSGPTQDPQMNLHGPFDSSLLGGTE